MKRKQIVGAWIVVVAMAILSLTPVSAGGPITVASYSYSTPPDADVSYYLDDTDSQLTDGVLHSGSFVPEDPTVGWNPATSTEITFDLGGNFDLTNITIGHVGLDTFSKFAPDDVTVTFSTDGGATYGTPVSSSGFTDFSGTTAITRDDLVLALSASATHVKVAFDGGVKASAPSGTPNGYLLDEIAFEGTVVDTGVHTVGKASSRSGLGNVIYDWINDIGITGTANSYTKTGLVGSVGGQSFTYTLTIATDDGAVFGVETDQFSIGLGANSTDAHVFQDGKGFDITISDISKPNVRFDGFIHINFHYTEDVEGFDISDASDLTTTSYLSGAGESHFLSPVVTTSTLHARSIGTSAMRSVDYQFSFSPQGSVIIIQ